MAPFLGFALVTLRPEVAQRRAERPPRDSRGRGAEAEGRGVGSALMDGADDRLARDAGAKTITLHVFESNDPRASALRAQGLLAPSGSATSSFSSGPGLGGPS